MLADGSTGVPSSSRLDAIHINIIRDFSVGYGNSRNSTLSREELNRPVTIREPIDHLIISIIVISVNSEQSRDEFEVVTLRSVLEGVLVVLDHVVNQQDASEIGVTIDPASCGDETYAVDSFETAILIEPLEVQSYVLIFSNVIETSEGKLWEE